jgi:hypothetical protein
MDKITIRLMAPFIAIILLSCGKNKNNGDFELKGNLSNAKEETIYLEKLGSAKPVIVDSTVTDENGNFEFLNYRPKIGFYRLKVNQQNFAMLVLDSTDKVTLTGDFNDLGNTYKTQGSEETKLFIEYNELSKRRDKRLDSLNAAFQSMMEAKKMDSKRMDSLSKTFEIPYHLIVDAANDHIARRIAQNTDKYSSIMAIQALDPDKYAAAYQALDAGLLKKFPGEKNVLMFHDMLEKMMATRIGETAPDIKLPQPDGN